MSYHLGMEKSGKVPQIDMPPVVEQVAQPGASEQQYDVHPDIAKDFIQQNSDKNIKQEAQSEEQEVVQEVEDPRPVQESRNERNIKLLREKAENADRYKRERDEFEWKLSELEKMRQQHQVAPEPEMYNPDDILEVKHLSKYDKKIEELEKKLAAAQYSSYITSTEALLKAKYPDIDQVVSKENLAILKMDYPALADSITANTNLQSQAEAAYTIIKKLGIAVDDNFIEDKIRAQKNAAKPKSMATLAPQQGESPLSRANAFANGLTDDLKRQLRAEMEAARRAL